MIASDGFSQYYAELLQGAYDCVDRIVLNAFYPLGQTGGGVARGGDACTATIRISTMNICAKWRGPFRAASMRSAPTRMTLQRLKALKPPDLFLHNHHQNLGRPLDAALPVDPRCDTCMDAKAFTDMVAR